MFMFMFNHIGENGKSRLFGRRANNLVAHPTGELIEQGREKGNTSSMNGEESTRGGWLGLKAVDAVPGEGNQGQMTWGV
jgi:hypothetical protein